MNKKGAKVQGSAELEQVKILLIGVALVTLIFRVSFYDPFNSPKLITVSILGGWLAGHLVVSIRNNPLVLRSQEFVGLLITVCFLSSLLISTLQTKPIIIGLIGDIFRRNGFVAYLSLAIVFLYSSRAITKNNSLTIYKSAVLTGLIVSCYGVLQIAGNDFVSWNNPYNNMISTVGNPNFASALLAILFVLSLFGLLLKDLSLVYKILSLLLLILAGFAIVKSESRQGLLAIFFAVLFYFSIYTYMRNKKYGLAFIIFASVISLLAILGMLQRGPFEQFLYKNSVSVRGYYWRAGLEMLRNFPLSGVGVDRYGAYFKEFREVAYPLKYGFDITSSNAHNTIIQLFATGGIFVGISYLALLVFVFTIGMRGLKNGNLEDKKLLLGLISAWLAFQAQSLISIDNIGVSIWGWFIAGAILGISYKRKQSDKTLNKDKVISTQSNKVKVNLLQPLLSVIFLIPILLFTSILYRSESDLNLIKNYASIKNKQFVVDRANKILNNHLVDPNYRYITALYLSDVGENEEAYRIISEIHAFDSRNPEYLKGLASLEAFRNDPKKEILVRNEITKIDPWNAENYLQLLALYKKIGDVRMMNSTLNMILSFAPNSEQALKAKSLVEQIE